MLLTLLSLTPMLHEATTEAALANVAMGLSSPSINPLPLIFATMDAKKPEQSDKTQL